MGIATWTLGGAVFTDFRGELSIVWISCVCMADRMGARTYLYYLRPATGARRISRGHRGQLIHTRTGLCERRAVGDACRSDILDV